MLDSLSESDNSQCKWDRTVWRTGCLPPGDPCKCIGTESSLPEVEDVACSTYGEQVMLVGMYKIPVGKRGEEI